MFSLNDFLFVIVSDFSQSLSRLIEFGFDSISASVFFVFLCYSFFVLQMSFFLCFYGGKERSVLDRDATTTGSQRILTSEKAHMRRKIFILPLSLSLSLSLSLTHIYTHTHTHSISLSLAN